MKYKLIKTYPNSPKIGTIAENNNGSIKYFDNENTWTESSSFGNIFDEMIKNYPEFWEEIIERDYEVLQFKCILSISDGTTSTKLKNGNHIWLSDTFPGKEYPESKYLNDLKYIIHSVKRLSDGKIFTIGDNVSFTTTNSKIKNFRLETDALYVNFESGNSVSINYVDKIKQPLFTTEDGVDIFEGDIIYEVSDFVVNSKKAGKYKKSDENHPVEHWYKDDIYFSTKEKAEEYILMNKPCLSLNDVVQDANKDRKNKNFQNSKMFKNFKELANTKING